MKTIYILTGESFELSSKKWIVYTAELLVGMPSDELSKILMGTELLGDGRKILGIETFATPHQNAGNYVGLAVEKL